MERYGLSRIFQNLGKRRRFETNPESTGVQEPNVAITPIPEKVDALHLETEKETRKMKDIVEIKFFVGPHGSLEDFKKLREELQRTDVLILEGYGWDKEYEERRQQVADGLVEPTSPETGSIRSMIENTIHNTYIKILTADVPKNHPEKEKIDRLQTERTTQEGLVRKAFLNGEFSNAVHRQLDANTARNVSQSLREDIIKEQLEAQLQSIKDTTPKLKEKDKIRVVVFFGLAHINVYKKLRKEGWNSKLQPTKSTVFHDSGSSQYLNKGNSGYRERNLYAARQIVEQMIINQLPNPDKNTDNNIIQGAARIIVEKLTLRDIEKIFKEISGTQDERKKERIFRSKVGKASGLIFPLTERECRNLVIGTTRSEKLTR